MTPMPAISPLTESLEPVRLCRGYYVPMGLNDYSVDPLIGGLVDIVIGLDYVTTTIDC